MIALTVVPLLQGLALAAIVARRSSERLRVMRILAIVLTVVSLVPPLTLDASLATRLVLAAMHPVAGGAFLWAVRAQPGPSRASTEFLPAASGARDRADM